MKRLLFLLFSLILFTGCTNQEVEEPVETETTSISEKEETTYIPPTPEPYTSYLDIVESFVHDKGHPLPGQTLDENWIDDEYENISENKFAILDINQDGIEELVINVTSTYHAGWSNSIYQYNNENGNVDLLHVFFSDSDFYSNGVVEERTPNNGPGAIWPYTLFKYTSGIKGYEEVGFVSSKYIEYMSDSSTFPYEIDKDGDGIVYEISKNIDGDGEDFLQLDEAAYTAWREQYLSEASPIKIEWHSVTVY